MGQIVKIVDVATLVALLTSLYRGGRGDTRVGVLTAKDPALRKGDRGRVWRVTRQTVALTPDVGGRREAAGLPQEVGPRKWGAWLEPDCPLATHNGALYLRVYEIPPESRGIIPPPRYDYYLDGVGVDPAHPEVVQATTKKDGTPPARGDNQVGYYDVPLKRAMLHFRVGGQEYTWRGEEVPSEVLL